MVNTALTAGSAIGGIEMIDQIPSISPKVDLIKLAIQLAIGIVAYLRMRKPKTNTDEPTK